MVIALLAVRSRGHLPQLGRDVYDSKRTRGAATEPSEPIDGRGIRGPVDISVSAYATGCLRVVRNSRRRLVRVREQNRRDVVVPVRQYDNCAFVVDFVEVLVRTTVWSATMSAEQVHPLVWVVDD